jgi:hypothetical protein
LDLTGTRTGSLSTTPIVYLFIKRNRFSRGLAIVWNGLGLLDFALAYVLGAALSVGPTVLKFPWRVITAGLVPLFMRIHAIILYLLVKNNESLFA